MATVDQRETQRRASRALSERRFSDAARYLWALLDRAHLPDDTFAGYLQMLGQAFQGQGLTRAVATIHLFLGQSEAAWRISQDEPLDLARCAVAAGNHREAAKQFAAAEWLGHAAIQLEMEKDDRGARVLWERLADDPALRDQLYTLGLVHFNLGRACERLGDRAAARRAKVQSMHLLEAAADGYETQGLRERAFDCFQVLLTLGKEGAFENLAEGYLNCIRILQEDNLKYYVLQYFEDFQELALREGELHAAATLFREAAEFARRHNMPWERHYRFRAAETHAAAAQKMMQEGASVELAENAFTAAIDAFNELGAFSKMREIFGALSTLQLPDKRRERYATLAHRLGAVPDEDGQMSEFPDYLRMETAYPEIWRLDVIEWEQKGDAAETMIEVIQDDKWPDFTRRRALLCRLHQLQSQTVPMPPQEQARLAKLLGRVEIYASLGPLEKMIDSESPMVRAAVLAATRQLFFKRSFILVAKGLQDTDQQVRSEALQAVSALHFGHAFDPLARIYRGASEPQVRMAALESIGKVVSIDAAELLIDVLRHGDKDERQVAARHLAQNDHQDVGNLLRRAAAHETGPARAAVEQILRERGGV
ncbi:MAG: HEAT repeat domain-containing protein [Myxococcota bacterium]